MNVKFQFEIISQKMKPFPDNFIIFYFTITRLKLTSSGEDKSACDRRGSKRPWEFCQAGCRPSRRTPWPGGTAADDALTPTRRRPRLVIPVIAAEERGLSRWLTLISRLDEEERSRVISGISVKSPGRNRLGEQVKKLVALLICFCITIIESKNNRCFFMTFTECSRLSGGAESTGVPEIPSDPFKWMSTAVGSCILFPLRTSSSVLPLIIAMNSQT